MISQEGLEAATIRRIAAELGGPTKLVTHYFADKQEMLVWAYRSLAEQGQQYVRDLVARDRTDIVGALTAMTATDSRQKQLWRVYVAFWDRAARDPFFADLQRAQIIVAVKTISDILRARHGDRADLESISQRLNAFVQGISILALADSEQWSAERTRGVIADEVELLLGSSGFMS